MSFCSLEEAWGPHYANLYKKEDSMLTSMPSTDNNIDKTILKDRNLTEISKPVDKTLIDKNIDKEMKKYYLNKKDEIEGEKSCETTNCNKFLEHFLDCEDCKKKINQILDINDTSRDKSIIEKFGNIDDNYLDIFIMILTGIFIIFILDCFVRLGKNFRK